ncbi:MAG: rhomboid family intramembrane serine protease [Rhizobiales bacterium TMED83]|nr:rhomboid family intramembrane serine protease [Rhodobiaceae bacterium]RPF95100.1 MAG: rhomboid family intramembrane serine protease [Rhizobiales bacterium TMED83]
MSAHDTPSRPREPAFRVPPVIIGVAAVILVFQLLMQFGGAPLALVLIVEMALFPARFFAENMGGLPGGLGQGIFSLVSYGFLHGGWSHCLINLAWLLAFGAPVARRLGARRFLALYLACVVAGGLVQVFSAGENSWLVPIIGASAGVSGMLGAAARFAFPETRWLDPATAAQRRRLLPILEVPKRRPVMMFIGVWVVINLVFGLVGPLTTGTMLANIAWQAQLGGFFAGLLLIGLVEKPPLSSSGGPGNVDYGDWKDRA